MRLAAGGLLVALLLGSPLVSAQAPPPPPPPGQPRDAGPQKTGTARLAGRVTSLDTGRPIRRAVVRAFGPELRDGKSVSTDADGRWELSEIPAGRLNLSVSKGGYVTLSYGQTRPFESGKTIDVAHGQAVEKLDFALPRGGAITGRVVDEFGEPVTNARVSPMRYRFVGGQRRLLNMGAGDVTDDLGQFRLHGLAPGDYYVSVQPTGFTMIGASVDRTGYGQTFYPGATSPSEAARVTIGIGQEAQDVVVALSPIRVANISGTAVTSSGEPVRQGMVVLRERANGAGHLVSPGLVRDGTWSMTGITPGEYLLTLQYLPNLEQVAQTGSSAGLTTAEIAVEPVTVTGNDIRGVALVTSPGGRARGRLRFEGGAAPSTVPGGLSVRAFEIDPQPTVVFPGGSVRSDWTFESRGLIGHRLLRVSGMPSGWYLKTIIANGADVTDTGLEFRTGQEIDDIEVTLTRTMAEVSGTVRDAKGTPVTDYAVVFFPEDASRWGWQSRYVKVARPDQSGRYLATGLPAATYYAVALDYLEPGMETDAEFLRRLKDLATSTRIADGEKKTLSIELSRQ